MRHWIFIALALVAGGRLRAAEEKTGFGLLPQASVSTLGVFLSDVVTNRASDPLPRIQLAPAPAIGRPVFFTRAQINEVLKKSAPELVCSNWAGADRVKVVRAVRQLDERTLRTMLTDVLQQQIVKDKGELELTFTRPWAPATVADDPLTLKILELPLAGITPTFVCRFEVYAGTESIGIFQQPVQARVWQEVYVAKSNLIRGTLLREAEIGTERRDLLTLREAMTAVPSSDPNIEFRENVAAGTPLAGRMFRLRAVIKRGKLVDATVQDPTMTISLKAEALEDGVPGQMVRLRNPRSKREFRGKVQDEQTVVVVF